MTFENWWATLTTREQARMVRDDVAEAWEAATAAERTAAELRCLKTSVLLDGLHPYTALKVRQMISDAVGMRSNV